MSSDAGRGWDSDLETFRNTEARAIIERLSAFVRDASEAQVRAWKDAVPPLQREASELIEHGEPGAAKDQHTILEYQLPLDSRRPDVVLLVHGAVVVLELKGKEEATQADLDQAAAYARDLRCYHRDCEHVPVHAVLVPMRMKGRAPRRQGVFICGPDALDDLISQLDRSADRRRIPRDRFLEDEAYRPLPTLVQAARELFQHHALRRVKTAAASTDPACERIASIIRHAAATKSRHLVLLSGVPGAGKTLVGLQTVHAHWLDDLAVPRKDGKPTVPAVFLSGNGPLVEVLQYELRAVGDGRTFVRPVKDYVERYSRRADLVPPEHVLVFDEAQRAWDAEYVRHKHDKPGKSEPEHFIEFAQRIPDWCVVVGLIGGGQEIHVGEEGGLGQWRSAVEGAGHAQAWSVHAPPAMRPIFEGIQGSFNACADLNLERELRFHLTKDVHRFVAGVVDGVSAHESRRVAETLLAGGLQLRITRDLTRAQSYLRERFDGDPNARFGLVASSRDRDLTRFRVYNDFQSTKRVHAGPWYGEDESAPGRRSCRLLQDCMTEFGTQGLELDGSLLAWGTDFMMERGSWSDAKARGFRKSGPQPRDRMQLRRNAYRVLLTRGRSVCVVFVPELAELDETHRYLVDSGFVELA